LADIENHGKEAHERNYIKSYKAETI